MSGPRAAIYRRTELRVYELTGAFSKATALSLRSAGDLSGYLLGDIARPVLQVKSDDTERPRVLAFYKALDDLFAA